MLIICNRKKEIKGREESKTISIIKLEKKNAERKRIDTKEETDLETKKEIETTTETEIETVIDLEMIREIDVTEIEGLILETEKEKKRREIKRW
jgi:hypothetical protein